MAALRDLGRRNIGTPLEIAPTPVRLRKPDEKARIRRKAPASPGRDHPHGLGCDEVVGEAAGAAPRRPVASFAKPTTTIRADRAHVQVGGHSERTILPCAYRAG